VGHFFQMPRAQVTLEGDTMANDGLIHITDKQFAAFKKRLAEAERFDKAGSVPAKITVDTFQICELGSLANVACRNGQVIAAYGPTWPYRMLAVAESPNELLARLSARSENDQRLKIHWSHSKEAAARLPTEYAEYLSVKDKAIGVKNLRTLQNFEAFIAHRNLKPGQRGRRPVPREVVDEIKRLKAKKWSHERIGAKVGRTTRAIGAILRRDRAGIK
jgi:hypothetical protein